MEALIDGLVDVVRLDGLGTLIDEALRDDNHLRGHTEDIEAGEHEGRAAVAGLHDAVLTDGGNGVVVRHEEREVRHVAVGAIGIGRPDGDLLGGGLTFENDLLRVDLNARHLGDIGRVILRAVGNPL